jgi:hypothetical protein
VFVFPSGLIVCHKSSISLKLSLRSIFSLVSSIFFLSRPPSRASSSVVFVVFVVVSEEDNNKSSIARKILPLVFSFVSSLSRASAIALTSTSLKLPVCSFRYRAMNGIEFSSSSKRKTARTFADAIRGEKSAKSFSSTPPPPLSERVVEVVEKNE